MACNQYVMSNILKDRDLNSITKEKFTYICDNLAFSVFCLYIVKQF